MNSEFWRNKKVLLTGHTGFKGAWLALWLQNLGAQVTGYSLPAPTNPSLFDLANVENGMQSIEADILDSGQFRNAMVENQPEVVFHLAAQSLVRLSYANPVATYATNVLGTVHVLEAVRATLSVRAVVIVTSDKCYENREDSRLYGETDRLGGHDPYSSSKACAEIVTSAYRTSFFRATSAEGKRGIASARAGNVIGGGDWAADRLIPDVMRATLEGREVLIRHPKAIRPWQHVLDPLCGYLTLAERLSADPERFSESWNFGPDESEALSVLVVLERLREHWGPGISWRLDSGSHPHEAQTLKLDCSKAKRKLGWQPQWNLHRALRETARWYKAYQTDRSGGGLRALAEEQIRSYGEALSGARILSESMTAGATEIAR